MSNKRIIISKNKETGKWEKISEDEYISNFTNANKQMLTIEKLKQSNSSFKLTLWITIPFLSIFIITGLFGIFSMVNSETLSPAFITPIMFILFPLAIIFFMLRHAKKEKKESSILDDGNFKIVEDKIYDKYMYVRHDTDGPDHYYYYVFTKIYGKLSVNSWEYKYARKDDSMYLLFYNGNEQNNSYNNIEEEEKRNRKIVDQEYLATLYELGPDLALYLVPYNETIGETNFNNRVKDMMDKVMKSNGKVKCKNCGKKYNLKKYDSCPDCSTTHHFDMSDVMNEEKWY